MDTREWLFVLSVIVVVVVALIAAARWRRNRFEDIAHGDFVAKASESDDFPTEELPSGGARTVGFRDPNDIEKMNDEIRARAEASKPRLSSFRPEPIQQQSLLLEEEPEIDDADDELEETVPLLLETADEHNQPEIETAAIKSAGITSAEAEAIGAIGSIRVEPKISTNESPPMHTEEDVKELEDIAQGLRDDEPELGLSASKAKKPSQAKSEPPQEPDEIIIINLMTEPSAAYGGEELYKVIHELGMRHGDMDIFHYCGRHGDEDSQFRMANLLKPGYFDIHAMDEIRTHALCFFFELLPDQDNMKVYESMLSVINKIRDDLGGELHDENRSVFTIQTSEHCRNRIRDFQRRHLLNR